MDVEVLELEHCAQMDEHERLVKSSNGRSNYRVRVFLPDEPDTCTCTGFAISRNRAGGKNHGGVGDCSHLRKVRASTCQWVADGVQKAQQVPGVCPLCFGQTAAGVGGGAVMPETTKAAAEATVDGLLAMAKRLGLDE